MKQKTTYGNNRLIGSSGSNTLRNETLPLQTECFQGSTFELWKGKHQSVRAGMENLPLLHQCDANSL